MNIVKRIAIGLGGVIATGVLLTGVAFAQEVDNHFEQVTLDPREAVNVVGTNHTVTATVTDFLGNPIPGELVSFAVVAGPNTGQVSDPGECSVDPTCHTDPAGKVSWTYTGSGGVGTDTIIACSVYDHGERHCAEALKKWIIEPVRIACTETVNPNGKAVPPAGSTTLPGPKGGQNEDGFYLLSIVSKFLAGTTLWVTDALGSGPFGPYNPGDKVKITQAPGATPSAKPIGSTNGQAGAIVAHITLKGDALVFAVDPAGVKHGPVSCLVPPPPK